VFSAPTILSGPSIEQYAFLASGQSNISLIDLSRSWNLPDSGGSNTGSYSSACTTLSVYQMPKPNLSCELAGRLNDLSLLVDGWDEGDALQINAKAVEAARSVLRQLSLVRPFQGPSIVPTFDGFLQLEWHNTTRSLELEYTPEMWSILGVASVNTGRPIYNTASVPLTQAADLERYYIWFSTNELIWPSR
jgi:hypothetical protein